VDFLTSCYHQLAALYPRVRELDLRQDRPRTTGTVLAEELRQRGQAVLEDRARVLPRPRSIIFNLTMQCCLRCRFCNLWRLQFPHMEPAFWHRAIDELYALSGPYQLCLSGGEPLLVPYLEELIAHASSLGIETAVPTNGFLLDAERIQRLQAAGLRSLKLSIDALGPLHDHLRRKEGLFDKVLEAIGALRGHNPSMQVGVLTVFMGPNLSHLVPLVEWVSQEEALGFIEFQALTQTYADPPDTSWYRTSELWPSDPAAVEVLIDQLLALQAAGAPIGNRPFQLQFFKYYFRNPNQFVYHDCMIGNFHLTVRNDGEVSSCFNQGLMGNLRENSLAELWEGARASLQRLKMETCRVSCGFPVNCYFAENARYVFPSSED